MSVVGLKGTIVDSRDEGLKGKKVEVLLETANTLLLKTSEGIVIVQKAGTVLQSEGETELLVGDEILGRLEDRIREGSS